MRDKFIHLQLAGHVIIYQIRELRAAFDAAEGASFPHTPGDELECWAQGQRVSNSHQGSVGVLTSSADLLASCCDSDDDALSPALVACLECRSHHTHIARAVEGVVAASVRHLNQVLLDTFTAELGRVDEVGGAELLAPSLLAIVDIHDDDLFSAVLYRALDDRETDASSTKDCDIRTLLYIRSHDCGTVTGCDTAAEQAGTVHWRFGSDGYNGYVGNYGVLGESGGAHEM